MREIRTKSPYYKIIEKKREKMLGDRETIKTSLNPLKKSISLVYPTSKMTAYAVSSSASQTCLKCAQSFKSTEDSIHFSLINMFSFLKSNLTLHCKTKKKK
jgi:transcription elongation factor GreA-like protein